MSVRETDAPGENASLTLEAVKGDRPRAGCEFTVTRGDAVVAHAVSPAVLAGLAPGRYDVHAKHRKIGRQQTTVEVRDGKTVTVTVQLRRTPATAIAMTIVRAIFYVFVEFVKAIVKSLCDSDDRCKRCDHRRCRCESRPPPPGRPPSAGKPCRFMSR